MSEPNADRAFDGSADPRAITPVDLSKKTVAEILGEVVWLMSQDAEHKQRRIADLERLVMPAILAKQFRIFYAPAESQAGAAVDVDGTQAVPQAVQAPARPVGAILWAMVSDAMATMIEEGAADVADLDAKRWHSGKTRVIALTITPFGAKSEMIGSI